MKNRCFSKPGHLSLHLLIIIVQINTDSLSGGPFAHSPSSYRKKLHPTLYCAQLITHIQVIIKRRSLGCLLACFFLPRTRNVNLAPYEEGGMTAVTFIALKRSSAALHGPQNDRQRHKPCAGSPCRRGIYDIYVK